MKWTELVGEVLKLIPRALLAARAVIETVKMLKPKRKEVKKNELFD